MLCLNLFSLAIPIHSLRSTSPYYKRDSEDRIMILYQRHNNVTVRERELNREPVRFVLTGLR